jgi:hypothetical protein
MQEHPLHHICSQGMPRTVLSSLLCHVTPQCVLRKVLCYQRCGCDGLSTTQLLCAKQWLPLDKRPSMGGAGERPGSTASTLLLPGVLLALCRVARSNDIDGHRLVGPCRFSRSFFRLTPGIDWLHFHRRQGGIRENKQTRACCQSFTISKKTH